MVFALRTICYGLERGCFEMAVGRRNSAGVLLG